MRISEKSYDSLMNSLNTVNIKNAFIVNIG